MNKPLLDTTLCVYGMDWSDKATGAVTRHYCQEPIDLDKLPPYRKGHGVCHRHERGLAGWDPTNCSGPCCRSR